MMRRQFLLATILVMATVPDGLMAQQIRPTGVVTIRRAPRTDALLLATDISPAIISDSTRWHPWRWVGAGALLGGVASGAAAAVAVSRSDDPFFAGSAVGIVTVAGGIVGGLLGGFVYLVAH